MNDNIPCRECRKPSACDAPNGLCSSCQSKLDALDKAGWEITDRMYSERSDSHILYLRSKPMRLSKAYKEMIRIENEKAKLARARKTFQQLEKEKPCS